MTPPSFYHPVVQFALPVAIGLLVYRAGELALTEVRNLPLQVVQIQARQAPLPPLVLPTIYVASIPESKSQDRHVATVPRSGLVSPAVDPDSSPVTPLKIVVQPRTLRSFLAGLKVNGMSTEGVLIDGIFYPFGKAIHFEDMASGSGVAATPVYIEKVGQKARFRFGKEIIDVAIWK